MSVVVDISKQKKQKYLLSKDSAKTYLKYVFFTFIFFIFKTKVCLWTRKSYFFFQVADILDLAVGAVKKEELDNNISLKNLFEGLEMTRTVLQKTFVKHGLKQISPEGEKFDPALHEAVFQIPKDKVSHFSSQKNPPYDIEVLEDWSHFRTFQILIQV